MAVLSDDLTLHILNLSPYKWWWWTWLVVFSIWMIIHIPLFVVHSVNIFRDLCTKERKSVWRENKPEITMPYILMLIFGLMAIILWFGAWTLMFNLFSFAAPYCYTLIYTAAAFYYLAKYFMYLTFLVRLKTVFIDTIFEYKTKTLLIVAIIGLLATVSNIMFTILFGKNAKTFYSGNMQFAFICDTFYPFYTMVILGIYDSTMCTGFLFAFIMPLKKIIKESKQKDGVNNNVKTLIDLNIQLFILTSMSSVSTVTNVFGILLTNSTILGTVDVIINIICIMLMTPYYPPNKYYTKICCCCIKCTQKYINYNETILIPHNLQINNNVTTITTSPKSQTISQPTESKFSTSTKSHSKSQPIESKTSKTNQKEKRKEKEKEIIDHTQSPVDLINIELQNNNEIAMTAVLH
eukprot:4585_1